MTLVKSRWFQILIIGFILFILTDVTVRVTNNVIFFPTLITLGAFLIPVAFVAYFYREENFFDRGIHGSILPTLAICALLGGLIGTMAAGWIEYSAVSSTALSSMLWVGLTEEFAKLIVPVAIFIIARDRFRSEMDGILFGVASGMAFAALETMGYGFVALVTSQGDINTLNETILVRGLISPAGHAAWTGIITATLWRARERTGKAFNPVVILFFLIAAALHAAWNIASSFSNYAIIIPLYIVIAGISLALLIWRLQQAKRSAIKTRARAEETRVPIAS